MSRAPHRLLSACRKPRVVLVAFFLISLASGLQSASADHGLGIDTAPDAPDADNVLEPQLLANDVVFLPAPDVPQVDSVVIPAPTTLLSHGSGNAHWQNTSNWPTGIDILDSLSTPARGTYALGDARQAWNLGQGRVWIGGTTSDGGNDEQTRASCPYPGTGVVRVCSYDYGPTGWAGRAEIYGSGADHIIGGSLKVNTRYGSPSNYYYMREVLCHEFGHFLGLAHQDYGSGCMRSDLSTGGLAPDQHDFDQVYAQHDHRHLPPPSVSSSRQFPVPTNLVTWSPPPDVVHSYNIYNGTCMGDCTPAGYSHLASVPGYQTSYNHDRGPAMALETNCYFVRAVADGGESYDSPSSCVQSILGGESEEESHTEEVWGP